MENATSIKALFIIVSAGFSDEAIDIARESGATGATIINSRGEGSTHKSFMGITVDTERELVLTLVKAEAAERIMAGIKAKMGIESPARGICFSLPVDAVSTTSLEYIANNNK